MGEALTSILDRIGRIMLITTVLYTIANIIFDEIPSYVSKVLGFITAQLSYFDSWDFTFTLPDGNGTLALVNHFFPLEESWQMVMDSIPFMLTMVTIRWMKSFIPFIGK